MPVKIVLRKIKLTFIGYNYTINPDNNKKCLHYRKYHVAYDDFRRD